jgi:hypothetical protein
MEDQMTQRLKLRKLLIGYVIVIVLSFLAIARIALGAEPSNGSGALCINGNDSFALSGEC